MSRSSPYRKLPCGLALALALLSPFARAGVIISEDFNSDPGWYSRDGEMTVAWSGTVGNPAGSMQGTFGAQDVPSPEIDAFRIDFSVLGGPWVGDYGTLHPDYTQFTFDFMAEDLLPSSFVLQISDGSTTFIRNLLPQVSSFGGFLSVVVPLAYDGAWLGGNASQFASVMGSVSFIDLQIARNTTGAQDYFVDNFALIDDDLAGPGGSAVPEPSSVQLWTMAAVMVLSMRRSLRHAMA